MKQNVYDQTEFFESYQALRLSNTCENELIEQPALRKCLPPLTGLRVLDLGCGGGQFARYCIDQGAETVTGVDLSRNMLDYAEKHNGHERITYVHDSVEDVELPKNQFDLVVSSLMMDYVRDYEQLVIKIAGCLRARGQFVYSTIHPHITARKQVEGWVRDEEGNKLYWPLDNYCEEGVREVRMLIDGIENYHRTMSTSINVLIRSGLYLQEVHEPLATPEGLKLQPHLISEIRRPTFAIFKSKKHIEHFTVKKFVLGYSKNR